MRIRKYVVLVFAALLAAFAYADPVTLIDCTGTRVTVNLPAEIVQVINDNYEAVENALVSNNVSAQTIRDVSAQVNSSYAKLGSYGLNTTSPITDAEDSLNKLCDSIVDVVPDSQMVQNVWAKAWLGQMLHIGGGLNTGISFMNITSLLDAAESLGIKTKGIPSSLPFPTVTLDARVSLPVFPVDIGATFSLLDTRKISGVSDVFNSFSMEFYNFGFDVRYPLIKQGPLNSILALGAGFYYSKGGIAITDDDASASLTYKAATFKIDAQYSIQVAVLVPFIGARAALTQASSDWNIDVNWNEIYTGESSYINMAQQWGILPTEFSGGSNCKFTESIRPQLYGGVGLDIGHFNLTASGDFDFHTKIPSAALSMRIVF